MNDFKRIRPIDGLRGLSVMLVLLCHLDVAGFSGGFVGVDVFFVISGFVITGSVFEHLAEPGLIVGFYERRIRRLLPSLAVTILLCYGAAVILDDREGLAKFAEGMGWTTLGISNFLFSRQAGYFDESSLENPLLHTWSLAVEEQFYILLSVLIVATRLVPTRVPQAGKRGLLGFVTVASVLSLVLSIGLSKPDGGSTYFLLVTRFWEIGVGSLLFAATREVPRRLYALPIEVVGLGLIVAANFAFDSSTAYPGWRALVPVLGAVLMIAMSRNEASMTNRFLSSRGMVFLGDISYALYLVHWPMIVFVQDYVVKDLSQVEKAGIMAASVGLAAALTYGVELPVRRRWILRERRTLFLGAAAGMVLLLGMATGTYFAKRTTGALAEVGNVPPTTAVSEAVLRNILPNVDGVWRNYGFIEPEKVPVIGPAQKVITAVWGDSHGLNILDGLVAGAARYHLSYRFFISYGTPPAFGLSYQNPGGEGHNVAVLGYIIRHAEIRNVIIAANWTGYLEGNRYFGHRGGLEEYFKFHEVEVTDENKYEVFERQFRQTVQALSGGGKKVFICTPEPTYPFHVPRAMAMVERWGGDPNAELSYPLTDYLTVNRKILAILENITKSTPNCYLIPCHLDLFKDDQSVLEADGKPYYKDGHHLTALGSMLLGDRIARTVVADGVTQ